MTDAQLVSGFEACVSRLVEERNRSDYIPLHIAIARPEGAGGSILRDNLFGPLLGHLDYTPRTIISALPPDSYAVAFSTPRDRGFIRSERANALIRHADGIAQEPQTLCSRLPTLVRQALCLPEIKDWWRTLFHLGWHFDRPFLRSQRTRLLPSDNRPTMYTDETCIQESGCEGQHDVLPGLIFGTLQHDAFTASEAAVGILIDSLRSSHPTTPTASSHTGRVFAQLRERFRRSGELEATMPGPKTSVKLLRYSNSFLTPPATEWAGLELGGEPESLWRLARINSDQEYCQIRGPATQSFNELAATAGNALPPGAPDDVTLFSEDRRLSNGFVTRVSAHRPILSPGAVERWLRFVFSTLRQFCPEELEIQWGTASGASSYGMATLKQNIFAASALAIELAGLTPTTGSESRRDRNLCFVEFREAARNLSRTGGDPERAAWQSWMVELLVAGVDQCVPQETLVMPGGLHDVRDDQRHPSRQWTSLAGSFWLRQPPARRDAGSAAAVPTSVAAMLTDKG